ncbi:MAG: calcium/sodium antiporter [Bacteroidetes bacterium]|nr:calcium/sodium antiporter [Bacteroidota bacterium]
MSYLYLFLGLTALVIGGEYLVRAAVGLSFKLKLSKMIIGLTVVSFATSAPELLVSLSAALNGYSAIALGNVIGSNIANIGLVLGITALISPIIIDNDFYKINWPVMFSVSVALAFLLIFQNGISAWAGSGLFACLLIYLFMLIKRNKRETQQEEDTIEGIDESLAVVSGIKIGIWLIIGALALYFGSDWLVKGAVEIASDLGVSQRVIAVTVIAVGTSVPELAASVIAALKKEKALSLGNLIGSNIFNIACVLGLTAMIHPIHINPAEFSPWDLYWMIGFAAALLVLILLPSPHRIGRYEGLFLLIAYAVFISTTIN